MAKRSFVETIKYTGANAKEVREFVKGGARDFTAYMEIRTPEGMVRIDPGCYVIKTPRGRCYPVFESCIKGFSAEMAKRGMSLNTKYRYG